MNRRNDQISTSSITLRRLFMGTALLGAVFGAGVIAGQRLLLQEGLPPLISIGEAATAPQPRESIAASPESALVEGASIFSFYESLTNADTSELDQVVAAPGRSPAQQIREGLPGTDTKKEENIVEDARYTLQVGAHPTIERARAEMDRLRSLALEPHLVATEIPGQGPFYRVRIGKFETVEQAQSLQEQLRSNQDVQSFVTPL